MFERIDDIDRCVLLLVKGYKRYENPYDEQAFHVAIWHDDLLEARDRGLVEGVLSLTHRQYEERKREEFLKGLRRAHGREGLELPPADIIYSLQAEIDGRMLPIRVPPLDEFDDQEDGERPNVEWLGIDESGEIRLTDRGWSELDALWGDSLDVPERVRSRIGPLIGRGLYDTALREFGVLIESRMREVASSELYGLNLVEAVIRRLRASGHFHDSSLKMLRGELRTAFKFVRNEFAHNVVDLPRPRAYALLGRMCHVLMEIDGVLADLDNSERLNGPSKPRLNN
ncbi:hypothetical protein ACIBO1_27475 [Micromonospora sp. NPDC049903]|uniref:hypothetical protein n=1 Tax=Micromonospora sp. NPDC049903 TaxID=3364276 RepID=UPI0037873D44